MTYELLVVSFNQIDSGGSPRIIRYGRRKTTTRSHSSGRKKQLMFLSTCSVTLLKLASTGWLLSSSFKIIIGSSLLPSPSFSVSNTFTVDCRLVMKFVYGRGTSLLDPTGDDDNERPLFWLVGREEATCIKSA